MTFGVTCRGRGFLWRLNQIKWRRVTHALGCLGGLEPKQTSKRQLSAGLYHPWENYGTAAAVGVVVSALFCICEIVFPSHPLING